MTITLNKTALRAALAPYLRSQLEQPATDVSLHYLLAIGKADFIGIYGVEPTNTHFLTKDAYTDLAVVSRCTLIAGVSPGFFTIVGRSQIYPSDPGNNEYGIVFSPDLYIYKIVGGTVTQLGAEGGSFINWEEDTIKLSIQGSTLKAYRINMTSPKITVSDTSFSSGSFGIRDFKRSYLAATGHVKMGVDPFAYLTAAGSPHPSAKAIALVEGFEQQPSDNNLLGKNWRIKEEGFRWGAFEARYGEDYRAVIYDGVIDNCKFKKYRSINTSYIDALDIYREFKCGEDLAGKDDFAFQILGREELGYQAAADFYFGHLIEHKTHYRELKRCDAQFIRMALNNLKERLEETTIGEADKHLNKVKIILSKGW
ncbi:MAG: hypothetical protein QXV17_10465 [Candidatus Micrarchaeaceae archaeon]